LGVHIGSLVELVSIISYDQTIQVRLDADSTIQTLGVLLSNVIMVEPIDRTGGENN
jgi:hypothetical protein